MTYYRGLYDASHIDPYALLRDGLISSEDLTRMAHAHSSNVLAPIARFPTGPLYHETMYNEHCPDNNSNYFHNPNIRNTYSNESQGYQQNIYGHTQYRNMPGLDMTRQGSIQSPPHGTNSPHDLTTVANAPDQQWMVTTSNIDIRTLTPPTTVEASNSSGFQSYQNQLPSYQQVVRPTTSAKVQPKSNLNKQNKPKGTPGRKRKIEDHQLPPEEAAKRRLRRERNKLAAAKCRNRRRELTDRLQGETDQLEDIKSLLHQDIVNLQREKEHLEFILAAHGPVCKSGVGVDNMQYSDQMMHSFNDGTMDDFMAQSGMMPMSETDHQRMIHHNDTSPPLAAPVSVITAGPSAQPELAAYEQMLNESIQGNNMQMNQQQNMGGFTGMPLSLDSIDQSMSEPLNTPVCTLATPSNTNVVFTYPSTPSNGLMTDVYTSSNMDYTSSSGPSSSIMSTGQSSQQTMSSCYYSNNTRPETCSEAHRRSSSSEGYQSPESVRSPKLLSL